MKTTTWKNRVLSMALAVIMALSLLPLPVFAAESGRADTPAAAESASKGTGTKDDPLLIGTAEEMREFGKRVNNGDYSLCARLTADIDLSSEKWTPIGTNANLYTGTFDGNGHTVSGIQFAAAIDMGLFAYVGNGGTVRDLFVRADRENTLDNSGILVRANYGHILRCGVEITATTTINGSGTFGVIARMNQRGGVIEDCYASCLNSKGETAIQVQEGTNANTIAIAGISSTNMGTIKSCFFRGRLRYTIDEASHTASPSDYAIIATSYGGTVENSYCLNTYTYGWKDIGRTETVKQYYIYKDEKSGYGYGDIGIHSTDFVDSANPITTRSGSLTWKLNEGKADGSWRLHVSESNPSDNYPTLRKTDSYVTKNEDDSYSIVAPHFHEIDGEQVEFKQVSSAEELCEINEGYVCLGNDSTVATFEGGKWNYQTNSGKDITLTDKWEPTGKVTLCLNGHKLYTTASDSVETASGREQIGYGIELNKGAELTLLDCSEKSTGWIGGSETDSAIYGVTVNKGGALRMESGCINRCETAVIVDGGDFTMTGGEIKGSTHVAGVEYRSGSLTLGGSAKVMDNSKSGAQNILLIRKGKKAPTIAFENLADNAVFGICVGEYDGSQINAVTDTDGRIPVTGENCRQYYKNLFADRFTCDGAPADYDLYLGENGAIEIGARGEHTHCLCGAEHKAGDCKDVDGSPAGHLTEEPTEFKPWDPYANLDEKGNPTLPTTSGSYYLTRSADIKSLSANNPTKWELNESNDVKLCLNGHTITYHVTETTTDNSYRGWICVQDGSTLTITDCSDQGTVTCDNQATGKDWISAFWLNGGTLNLYGGTVKNFMRAVYIPSGTFNMYGGTLTENSFESGVGVYCWGGSATFNLYGGSITNNKALWSYKYGNNIKGYSSSRMGGGVHAGGGAEFTMYGGEISNNGQARGEADEPIWRGGGVYVEGDFTMTGGRITGNTAAVFAPDKVGDDINPSLGGGVYVSGSFTMTGGEISGNTLDGIVPNGKDRFISRGGGVCVGGGFTMRNATISGNTVTSGVGGGVYVGGNSSISNAHIEKNKVSYSGNTSRYFGAGGGIFVNGKSSIEKSFITDNKVTDLKAGSSVNRCCRGGGGIFLGNYGESDVNSSIIGCTITGNTLEGSATATGGTKDQVGGGGVLVNIGTLTVENTTISGNTMTTTDGSAMLGGGILCYKDVDGLTLKGNVAVKDNTSGGSASNLYFKNGDKTDFTATVGGVLTGGKNSIGVTKVGADGSALAQPILIAKAAEGYTATQEDASCFFDDGGTYFASLEDDGSIQLTECLHTKGYTDGKCNICDVECKHPDVEEKGSKTLCTTCSQQMVVKAEKDGKTTYYAKKIEKYTSGDYEETLLQLFKTLESGSTVTLLADGLHAGAYVSSGKTITLNMNGKSLTEEGYGGITVENLKDDKNSLIVTGSGSSTAPEGSNYSCAFRVRSGELVFDESFSGKYDTIRADGGTLTFNSPNAEIGTLVVQNAAITLKGGKFGTICGNIGTSVQAGSLLERGYAFQKADGSYVAYDTEITATSALENVTVVKCDHQMTEMPTGNQYNRLKCPNCDEALEAVLKTADGKINGYKDLTDGFDRTGALSVAETTPGCTVTMYYDAEWLSIWSTAEGFTLDANDCEIAQLELHEGTLTVKNATITGSKHNGVFTVKTYSDFFDTFRTTLTLENCEVQKLEGADPTTLSANGPLTLKNTLVNGKTSVFSDTDEGLTVEESDLNGNVTVRGNLTFKSGYAAKITVYGAAEISGGTINELDATDAGSLTVSGGMFGKITAPDEKQLIDCLKDGYAFRYNDVELADGRTGTLEGVYAAEHTHGDYKWDFATHEKVCACGDVKETDAAAPTFDGIADGETYYQNTLTFTVSDATSGVMEVKDGDKTLTPDASGQYTITADNGSHTITATDNAGNIATVTVTAYKVYNVTLPTGTGYTVTGDSTAKHGQKYTFTVNIAEGYSRVKGSYKVLVNDTEVNAGSGDENSDRFKVIALGDLTITVEGIADITAPDVEMTIGANKFKELLNSLTFGLFFKETQTVTVTATDLGSRVDDSTAAYLVADGVFDKTSMPTEGWTSFEMKNGKGSFSIEPNAIGSVYVRVADKDGNLALINSDGVVIYTDSEKVTDSIEFTRRSKTNVTVTVDFKGNTVNSVSCGDDVLDSEQYEVLYPNADSSSTLGTIELKNAFLRTLAAGEYTITVAYDPMGVKYNPTDGSGSEAPATTEVTLTVAKAERTLEFSAPNATYDGEAYDSLTITDKPAGTTVEYMVDGSYTPDAPKNVGSYTVKITVAEDEDYNAKTFTKDFTISPKEVTIKDVVVKAVKEYDGSTAAKDMSIDAAYIDGKCAADDLTIDITGAEANFSDKNVGVGKIVTFSGFKLGGSAKDNYKLTDQPASITADITAKALTIGNLKVKDKLYDGTNQAEIDGTPTLKGMVDGDTLTLVNGTPAFSDTAVGKNIVITFTPPFALAGDEVTVKNYTLTQPTGITADIHEWAATGDEFTTTTQDWSYYGFTVTAKDGYQLSLTNTADGSWTGALTAPNQPTGVYDFTFYVKDTATGAISTAVTRAYKIDKAPPTGTVTLTFGGQSFTFDDFTDLTFDTFSNGDVTVTATGTDVGSGVKSVSYYKSDKVLTDMQVLRITDWTVLDGDHFTIEAEDMTQFILYVRIVDRAGNERYLNTNGVVFDTTAPEIVGVENGKTYYVTHRVAADDENMKSVTVNGEPVDMDTPFNLIGDTDAVYTIVATDKAGNVTTYTVNMKPISTITDAIKDITVDNVTSADADTIDQVAQQILDIAAESDEDVIGAEQWSKLLAAAENGKKLERRIAEVSAEISLLTEAVKPYDIAKVTSADRAAIEQLIADIDALLATDNLTPAERAALEALKTTAQSLLERIAAAKSAAEADEIVAVKDITKDNVALNDKDDLQKAEKALEKALDDFGGNYTDDESKALNNKLDTVKAALAAIERAERAAEEVKNLPSADEVKLTDKDEIERVSKIIDALTENEKGMLGETALGKLKALNNKLTELAANKPTSPSTGDTDNLAMWIALLFINGGVITGVTVAGKKKEQQDG